MADDRTALLKRRAEQANQKFALLREGLEPEISDDVLGVVRWRPSREAQKRREAEAGVRIPFHVPMTRAHRLATADGATSFHFAHSFINKVPAERMEGGRRNRPGAARAHNTYVERETAVAILADAVDPAIAASPSTEPANAAGHEENDHEHEEEDGYAAGPAGGRSEGTDVGRPFLQRHLEILGDFSSGDDAEPGADLCLLSGFELVRHGGHPELLVQGAAQISVGAGPIAAPVRQPRSRPGRHAGAQASIDAHTPSGHDRYLVRGGAVAIQPDGDRVLFTNIDADPAKRAEFWTLVEAHERSAGSDQMSCRFADRPDFWDAVVRRNDCPPVLRDQHATVDHDKIVRFDIDSGKAMRKFLKGLDGWIAKGGEQTFAKFHDGRAGRTQYRIVGELPDELPMAGKVKLLRDFTEEFRRRRIPFVAVMHAPDHNNNEKNWHFHLVYYDRPCARITAAQIAELEQNGHDTGRLAPGMWDFAAPTVKKDRVNRELWPLRQKKVAQVGNDRWIKNLRHSFANMTNVQLEQAGVARRVDPHRHADMGIVADPQEHLGTRQAAAETRGTVTAAGTRNEERQSQAIVTQIDQTHAQALEDATKRAADLKRRLAGRPIVDGADPLAEVERNLIAAADLDRLAAGLRHADDRAVSRATNLKRMNGQLVQAIDADASAASRRERQSRAGIVAGADRYLHILDVALRDDRRLIADCTDEAGRRREAARQAEARLEELANAPTVAPTLVTEPTAPSPQPIVDPVEQWLRQIEQRRPLILLDGKSFVLDSIKPPIGIDTAPAQARLGKLYRSQQDDIARIVRRLPAHRLSLGIRTVDGQTRRYLDGVEPALARTFFRYQDSPEIKAAVEAIIHPEMAARSAPVFEPPPMTPKPVAAAKKGPAPDTLQRDGVKREAPQVATRPAMAAAVPPPQSAPPPATPILPVAKAPGRATAPSTSAPKPPSPDPAIVARDLVARNVPLTFDEDDRIDRAALLAAKVDAGIVGALQNNAYLAGRVGMQVEQALARVQKHARSNPLNLIRRGEQITLGGDAPAQLIELSRFHARAPRMQDQLRQLHDELNAQTMVQSTPTVESIEVPLPKVEQASSDVRKLSSSADILQGEAARQAALRAAWQRGG